MATHVAMTAKSHETFIHKICKDLIVQNDVIDINLQPIKIVHHKKKINIEK